MAKYISLIVISISTDFTKNVFSAHVTFVLSRNIEQTKKKKEPKRVVPYNVPSFHIERWLYCEALEQSLGIQDSRIFSPHFTCKRIVIEISEITFIILMQLL